MAAATQAVTAEQQRHLSVVQRDGRAGFGALRAELHARCADEDLAALWADLSMPERKAVIASARMEPRDATLSVERMHQHDRNSIRAAIGRMSRYATRLGDQLKGESPSRELAANARRALAEGDTVAALHWLSLIEAGAH